MGSTNLPDCCHVSPLSPRWGSESDATSFNACTAHKSESHLPGGRTTIEWQGEPNPTWMLFFLMGNKNERRSLTSWPVPGNQIKTAIPFLITFDSVSRSGLMVQLPSSHRRFGIRPLGSHQPLWSCLPRGWVTTVPCAGDLEEGPSGRGGQRIPVNV